MKVLLASFVLLGALAVALPAAAQHDPRWRDARVVQRDSARTPTHAPTRARDDDRRSATDDRRDMQRDDAAARRTRRDALSPDERRQLRRDIGDYGRDIYKDRSRNGHERGDRRGRN